MERRAVDRLEIPGANVTYKRKKRIKGIQIFDRFSRPFPLRNFTKSGICFELDRQFNYGERICVELKIPGYKNLRLESDIRWIKGSDNGGSVVAGAQFRPFGKSKDLNSLKSLDELREIYQQFHRKNGQSL